MSVEKTFFRENYEILREMFPGKMVVSNSEVAKAFGIDPKTAKKRYNIVKGIELTKLASLMSVSAQDIRKAYKLC